MLGTLFIVATPIGNLEDLTFRALRTLQEVELIAAEDTRRTAKLLAHYAIRKPMLSLREHNERRESNRIIARLNAGDSVALVSDAGTPGIADPGARLVRAVRGAGLPVIPIPGASAVATAMSVSGHLGSEFVFMGFPPVSGTARSDWFHRLRSEDRAVIFFESTHRLLRTLGELTQTPNLVKRHILVHKELTKINEKSVIWDNDSTAPFDTRGEFTVVVLPGESGDEALNEALVTRLMTCLQESTALDLADAIEFVSRGLRVPSSVIKRIDKKHRYSGQ